MQLPQPSAFIVSLSVESILPTTILPVLSISHIIALCEENFKLLFTKNHMVNYSFEQQQVEIFSLNCECCSSMFYIESRAE